MITHRSLQGIGILCLCVAAATAAEPTLKEIMQGLRDNLAQITDGLLSDDFERVAQGATAIAQHAPIADSQVSVIAAELGPEMAAFEELDELVHHLSLSISTAAKDRDRNRAIANYRRLVDGCLACHAVYKERIAALLPGKP